MGLWLSDAIHLVLREVGLGGSETSSTLSICLATEVVIHTINNPQQDLISFRLTTHRISIDHEEIALPRPYYTLNDGRVSLESHSTFMAVTHTGPPHAAHPTCTSILLKIIN